jgi:hypothetical protein
MKETEMGFSLYEASVPVYVRQLNALSAILDKAAAYADQRKIDPAALLQARLYPDMLPFAVQIQAVCNHARRGAARLSGMEPAKVDDNQATFADLQALIGSTVESLKQVDPKEMEGMADREVTFPVGESKMTMTAANYLLQFSMPNFYFHVTTAYCILRHNGLEIGKGDFMGQTATPARQAA